MKTTTSKKNATFIDLLLLIIAIWFWLSCMKVWIHKAYLLGFRFQLIKKHDCIHFPIIHGSLILVDFVPIILIIRFFERFVWSFQLSSKKSQFKFVGFEHIILFRESLWRLFFLSHSTVRQICSEAYLIGNMFVSTDRT